METVSNKFFVVIIAMFLSACSSIPADYGRSDVNEILSKRGVPVDTSDTAEASQMVEQLTASPLTADAATRLALINNADLKKTYAELGIAAADVYEAGRIRNPIFSFSSLDSNESGERNLNTYGLVVAFTDLITLPSRKRFAQGEFEIMKQTVGAEVISVAAETRAAFYEFVAAKQVAALRAQIAKAGDLSQQLAQRYFDAGNLSPREIALERAAASESKLELFEADAGAYEKRTMLANLLGLSVAGHWDAPAQLSMPLAQEEPIVDLIKLAMQSRLDLAAARKRADLRADQLGVSNWTRWLGELEVGVEHERETDGADLTGPTVEWEVPIFTQNRDINLRADAELKMAIAEVEHLIVSIENDVRLAYAATLNAKSRVDEYRQKLIPARIEAVERAQEEEAFMLIGIFELLESKQDEYDTYQRYLESVRDYWLARTELARAVGNTLPGSGETNTQMLDVEDYIAPQTSTVDHSAHGSMHTEPHSDEHDAHSHH